MFYTALIIAKVTAGDGTGGTARAPTWQVLPMCLNPLVGDTAEGDTGTPDPAAAVMTYYTIG